MVTVTCSISALAHCGHGSRHIEEHLSECCPMPGRDCSTVTRTSFGNSRAQGSEEGCGLLLGRVEHCLDPTGRPFEFPDCPGFQSFRFGCSLIAVIDAHCFRARMVWISVVLPIYAALSWRYGGTCSPFSISISLSRRRITSTEPLRPIRTTAGRKLMNCMDCVRL